MKNLLLVFVISASCVGSIAFADGYAQTMDKPVGNYIANVDYNTPTTVIDPDVMTQFSFQLWNKDRTKTINFTDVWVSITPAKSYDPDFGALLSNPASSEADMSYTFYKGGLYNVAVSYDDNDKTLAEATFQLKVDPSPNDTYRSTTIMLSSLLLIGIIISLWRWHG